MPVERWRRGEGSVLELGEEGVAVAAQGCQAEADAAGAAEPAGDGDVAGRRVEGEAAPDQARLRAAEELVPEDSALAVELRQEHVVGAGKGGVLWNKLNGK